MSRVVGRNRRAEGRTVVYKLAAYLLQVDGDLFDVPLIHVDKKLREDDPLSLLGPALAPLTTCQQQNAETPRYQPENHGFKLSTSPKLLKNSTLFQDAA